jgi:hypothetical protein
MQPVALSPGNQKAETTAPAGAADQAVFFRPSGAGSELHDTRGLRRGLSFGAPVGLNNTLPSIA